jgi:hypothetical protein
MGGGVTDKPEVAKRLQRPEVGGGDAPGTTSEEADLTSSVCERQHTVSFTLASPAEVGASLRITLGEPPVVVADGRDIGVLNDIRQAATLAACIKFGYRVVGEVVAIDADRREGFATVTGVR